jgi:hypothetical protein
MGIWNEAYALNELNRRRRRRLDQMNVWRNAIAHQDDAFTSEQLALIGTTTARLRDVRAWRAACNQLASVFDEVVAEHLGGLVGQRPW